MAKCFVNYHNLLVYSGFGNMKPLHIRNQAVEMTSIMWFDMFIFNISAVNINTISLV